MMHGRRACQSPTAFGILSLQQMALARARAHDLAAGGDFEPLGSGFLGLDTLRTTHKDKLVSSKKDAQYRGQPSSKQGVIFQKKLHAGTVTGVTSRGRRVSDLACALKTVLPAFLFPRSSLRSSAPLCDLCVKTPEALR